MKISGFSIRRPVFTTVTMLLVLILGIVSFIKIPLTLIPELNPPVAVVVTSYPGAGPEEVSEKVTKPLENSLSTLPGLDSIQSTSQEGANLIFLQFDWSTEIDDVQMDVLQRIDQTPVPDDSGKPQFMKFDPSQFPVIQLSLRSDGETGDIREIAEKLETELRRTEGVASVTVSSSLVEDVQIVLDPGKLEEYGLEQQDVVQAIQANNISLPGEAVETEDGKRLTTRIISTLASPEDIRELVLTVNPLDGKEIKVSDIGEVNLAADDGEMETRTNDEPSVIMSVLQESGANTADVSTSFKESLVHLLGQPEFGGVTADILFDQGDYIQLAIGNIGQSLILGGIFAMLVLFMFLKSVRSPIIIGVAIPYSVIVTFVLMYFADFALNILTLGALALGIGMLVDNSIVVIENIERHLAMGKKRKQAALDGTKEVGGAITASTLTTIAVFLPVIFISGLIGRIFTEFALTISFSLLASLFVALTVIPMMASRMLKKPKRDLETRRRRSKSYRNFERSVTWSLQHRKMVLGLTALLLVAGAFGLYRVGTEFLPATDEGFVSISVNLPDGASSEATGDVIRQIEERLKKESDVDVYVSLTGGTQQGLAQGTGEADKGELYIKLKPLADRNRSVFEFVDDVQPDIRKLADEDTEITFNLQTAAGSSPNTLTFTMSDTDKSRLEAVAAQAVDHLSKIEGVTDVTNDLTEGVEEILIEVDRNAASANGFAPAQIASTVNDMTRGVDATQIVGEEGDVHAVRIRTGGNLDSVEALEQLKLRAPSGSFVTLASLAEIEIAEGPAAIRRVDQANAVRFTVHYESSRTLGEVTGDVEHTLKKADLPQETDISYSGDRELFEDAIDDMLMAVILAVVLVYIVMAAQFESFKYPLVIMFTVPLMIIGVALGLFATNTPISVSSVIGILILVGIVVNNGIVLVDYINQRKQEGMPSLEAITVSVKDRMRPILMTALTTILGLLPLALGIGEGTEINRPMGIAVIGGLISSTALTLYIVPVVYSLFDRETRKQRKSETNERIL
ncbi:hydrophobic/amphiphilic exporter-1, HAE1 family [Bhargavaea beijingensis]|uniref:Hydrophobic/amphiphilic exporter-1, HAE1 family n=1 Tax=Bhargavaea beijingensis TaxID=426756 RepID=A0A1G7BPK6_9BACL|nr:efflux RND transporter permease subunit [Bhargavaea beijingensis]SDE28406.1 hydrophobic/amphiphilic exporter-1, HAE1 family [Bhargavaea beijingensis]